MWFPRFLQRRGFQNALPQSEPDSNGELRYVLNSEVSAESVALLREAVGWDGRQEKYEKILLGSYCYAGCYAGDVLVGFGRAISDGVDDAVIFDLAVLPAYQRRSIASRLIDMLIAYCARQGVKAVCVLYEPHLARFYHKRGFYQICAGVIDTELMNGPWRITLK